MILWKILGIAALVIVGLIVLAFAVFGVLVFLSLQEKAKREVDEIMRNT